MTRSSVPLADIHVHLYGSIYPSDYLEFVRDRDVDWDRYESAYHAAFGVARLSVTSSIATGPVSSALRRSSTACSSLETVTRVASSAFRRR